MSKLKYVIFFLFLSQVSVSQQSIQKLNFGIQNVYENALLKSNELTFTGQRPFLYSDLQRYINLDSIQYKKSRDANIISRFKHPLWWKKLRTEDLIYYKKNGFELKINPIIDFSIGKQEEDRSLYYNTRGVDVSGDIGDKFSFGTGFYESQAVFPTYYSKFIAERRVVPGQGRSRVYEEDGYDFGRAYGYISYTPSSMFNFQIGHGKHFIGEGYRSLIISDNAFNLPYAKSTFTWKRIRYTNLLVAFQGTKTADGGGEIENRRYGSFTHLDFLIGQFAELGIIESVIWQKKGKQSSWPNPNFFNPILFSNTIQYGMNSTNNVLLGLNAKLKFSKFIVAYGQLVFDDTDELAYQVGAKWYGVFKMPLFLQIEYNVAKPYTYNHWDLQSYTHYNQELAHPLGANFSELLVRGRFRWKDFILFYQFNYAKQALNSVQAVYGSDLFEKELRGSFTSSGEYLRIINHTMRVAFLVNPASNFQLYFENRIRENNHPRLNKVETFWMLGMRTNIQNLYSDF